MSGRPFEGVDVFVNVFPWLALFTGKTAKTVGHSLFIHAAAKRMEERKRRKKENRSSSALGAIYEHCDVSGARRDC